MYTKAELERMDYKSLQKLCKESKIGGKGKRVELVDKLVKHYSSGESGTEKPEGNHKPKTPRQTRVAEDNLTTDQGGFAYSSNRKQERMSSRVRGNNTAGDDGIIGSAPIFSTSKTAGITAERKLSAAPVSNFEEAINTPLPDSQTDDAPNPLQGGADVQRKLDFGEQRDTTAFHSQWSSFPREDAQPNVATSHQGSYRPSWWNEDASNLGVDHEQHHRMSQPGYGTTAEFNQVEKKQDLLSLGRLNQQQYDTTTGYDQDDKNGDRSFLGTPPQKWEECQQQARGGGRTPQGVRRSGSAPAETSSVGSVWSFPTVASLVIVLVGVFVALSAGGVLEDSSFLRGSVLEEYSRRVSQYTTSVFDPVKGFSGSMPVRATDARSIAVDFLEDWANDAKLPGKWMGAVQDIQDIHSYMKDAKMKALGIMLVCDEKSKCSQMLDRIAGELNDQEAECMLRLQGPAMHGPDIAGATQSALVQVLRVCPKAVVAVEEADKMSYGGSKVFVNAMSEGGHFQDKGEAVDSKQALYILTMESKTSYDSLDVEKFMSSIKQEFSDALTAEECKDESAAVCESKIAALALRRRIEFVVPVIGAIELEEQNAPEEQSEGSSDELEDTVAAD